MELQIPYRLCAKVSEKSILQRKKKRSRKNPEDTLRIEEGENPRSRGMPRPCAYALGDPAQSKRIQFHGVSQREEQSNDLRKVPGIEIQVSEQGVLVPWVLRRHGREKCKKDRGVHPSSVGRR